MRRDQRLIEQAFKAVVMSAGVFAVVTRPVPRRGRPVFDRRKISALAAPAENCLSERESDRRRSRGDRYRLIPNGPIQNAGRALR